MQTENTIDALYRLLPSLLPECPVFTAIRPVSEARAHPVWKADAQNGRSFAVKHHLFAPLTRGKPYDLLDVEQRVSDGLYAEGVPVPRVLAIDRERGLVVTDWCGDHTLDDICQTAGPNPVADRVVDALIALEEGFHRHAETWAPQSAPGCRPDDLKAAWTEIAVPIADIFPDLAAHLTGRQPPPGLSSRWRDLIADLSEAPAALGPTDYNARNIAIDDNGAPAVLELAKIGYDWPERRIVQYTTSLGADRPDGRIVGLLTPKRAQHYARRTAEIYHRPAEAIGARLEAHHLVFHTLAAIACLNAASKPDPPWQNVPARLRDLCVALASPLHEHPRTRPLRVAFQ